MIIRQYKNEDCDVVSKLFYETVHSVNVKDYKAEQLSAWANNYDSLKVRQDDLISQKTLIAETNGVIVGFGSIDKSGCLDLLFIHKDYQRQGIATALCDELEKGFVALTTYASITAKPFFRQRGYAVVRENTVEREGTTLVNFVMRKPSQNVVDK